MEAMRPMAGQHARGSSDRSARRVYRFLEADTGHYTKDDRRVPGRATWSRFGRMMMSLERALVILACCTLLVLAAPTTYDQRQTGDLNVQIHLKDVKVVALVNSELLDDYTDYDYFYDYADFTIKPIVKPTTGATSSVEPWSTWPTNPPSSSTESSEDAASTGPASTSSTTISSTAESSSDEVSTTESSEASSSQDSSEQKPTTGQISLEESSTESNDAKTSTTDQSVEPIISIDARIMESSSNAEEPSSEKPAEQLSGKRCRSGFSPVGKGRCRRLNRRRLPFIPFAVRLAPQLLGMKSQTRNTSR